MAIIANLFIDQGTDYAITVDCTDSAGEILDLTGYTAASQIRKHYTSSNATNMSVTLNGNSGIVTLTMNNSVTAAMTSGRYVYDLELTDSSNVVSRIVEGTVTITPQVTSS